MGLKGLVIKQTGRFLFFFFFRFSQEDRRTDEVLEGYSYQRNRKISFLLFFFFFFLGFHRKGEEQRERAGKRKMRVITTSKEETENFSKKKKRRRKGLQSSDFGQLQKGERRQEGFSGKPTSDH